jgi:hypothetical protein
MPTCYHLKPSSFYLALGKAWQVFNVHFQKLENFLDFLCIIEFIDCELEIC